VSWDSSGNVMTARPNGSGNSFGFTTMFNGNSSARPSGQLSGRLTNAQRYDGPRAVIALLAAARTGTSGSMPGHPSTSISLTSRRGVAVVGGA
jgi:hypothetical protein